MFRIDSASAIPPFEQLRAQLSLAISSGRLTSGSQLPTVRGLAADVGVSNGTVARAYRELESAGLVVGRGRQGTFVAHEPAVMLSGAERHRSLAYAAGEFARHAHRLGFSSDAAHKALGEALEKPSNANRAG